MSPVHSDDGAEMEAEPLQHLFGAGGHPLVLLARLLGRRDRDELDLPELVLADHAARVLARRSRLGAEAERAGGEAQGQRLFVDDAFAHEVGHRHFRGRDEPEVFLRGRPFQCELYGLNKRQVAGS